MFRRAAVVAAAAAAAEEGERELLHILYADFHLCMHVERGGGRQA
jgi:hypothetical protein